ncbi:MAG TPA: lysoplasmalogenase [Rhizobiaceae bacterium]|nr:lysoplasmalogenase [Rhizobiaceae bacterium]
MMPFPGGIEDTSNAALILSAAAALLTLYLASLPASLVRSLVKTLAVALLAVLAFVQQAPLLLVGALALSAAGDAFLSRPGDRAFLAGLASFLAAHLLYIALFALSGGGVDALMSFRAALAAAMLLGVLLIATRLLPRLEAGLKLPVALYIVAILAMGLAALTLNSPAVIAGAILFIISDGILAWEKFLLTAGSPVSKSMRHTVWITYYAAQLLITLGFLLG